MFVLAGVAWLVGASTHASKRGGTVPGQGTDPGCGFSPQLGCIWEAINKNKECSTVKT